jgi:glycosyltransferase involved in cell wall biosynthesis
MHPIEVSVIIPTKNRTDFLERALHSVTSQNSISLEVCVVDNNKEEAFKNDVRALVEKNKNEHPAIQWHYLFSEKDHASGARNDGMKNVSGKYICFLDDDDYLLPGSIATRVSAMQHDPQTALLYSACYSKIYPYPFRIYRYYKYNKEKHKGMLMMMSCSSMFINRSLFAEHGLFFDERLCRRDDYDLCKQLIAKDLKVVSLPHPLMVVNLHSRQRISSNPLNFYDDRDTLRSKWGAEIEPNMYAYAEGLYIWRKCFGMKTARYKDIVTQLKNDFGRKPSTFFSTRWKMIALSPLLYLCIYHCMIGLMQVYRNRLSSQPKNN